MKVSGIYQIQSKTKPERIYIGSAISFTKRWRVHLSYLRRGDHHSVKLQNHYTKYGEGDLQFSILLLCEKEDLIKVEQAYLDTYHPWFNVRLIAGSALGWKHSEETKQVMSKKATGRKSPNKGVTFSDEHKKNLSISHQGQVPWMKGKHVSKESKQKRKDTLARNKLNKTA
jgi:group I intron endonuclease